MADNLADRFARPLLALLDSAERALERALVRELERWEASVAVPAEGEARLATLLSAHLARVGDGAVEIQDRQWARLAAKDVQTFRAERMAWVRDRGAALARNLTEDMRVRVRDILAEAARQGLGPAAIQGRIREIVPALPGASVRVRAATIAQTELHNAATHAQEMEARALVARGADLVKVWTATMDARTRPAHRSANGQTREMGQDFTVGGARMSRPGDPRGGARNVIRCRCVARYLPRRQVADDRSRRARDIVAHAQRQQDFVAELARITDRMDPALARVVREEAARVSEGALVALDAALAALRAAEER